MHRRLGAIAPALMIVMVVLAFQTTLEMVRRGHDGGQKRRTNPDTVASC